jgi:glycosyl transferase family 2
VTPRPAPLEPDVSVVLPVFLREPTPRALRELSRAVESVLGQDHPGALEVLVVDDGSRTPVTEVVAGAAWAIDPRIRWIRVPRNTGLVNALNTGLVLARCPLIARIDADDAWRPGKLAKQLALFAADPDLTIVGTGMRLVHAGEGEDVDLVRPGDWQGILRFFATEGCPFPHGSVLARREVYLLLGGYPHAAHLSHCEDFALWGTWVRFFKPAMIEEVLFDYTVAESSVSGLFPAQQRKASGRVQRTFLDLGDASLLPAASEALASALGTSLVDAGRVAFRIWKYGAPARLPEAALDPLRTLLPDRRILAASGHAPLPPEVREPAASRCVRIDVV